MQPVQISLLLRSVLSHSFALALIAVPALESALSAAQSDSDKVAAFVSREQAAIDKAKSRLLKAIDRQSQQIRRSNADDATKQFSLQRIEEERRGFANLDRLPSCDELLEPVFDFLNDYQKIYRRIQKDRKELTGTVQVRANTPEAQKLAALDARLDAFLGNPDRFTANSKWAGRRWDDTGSKELKLEVHERSERVFRGKLAQIGKFGRADTMKVVGALDGNVIDFHTAEMIRGEDRLFVIRGYLINDRIIAQLTGLSTERKPILAMVSLSRVGAAK
jgi:hypothetical protein